MIYDVIIVGAGPAGLSAALHAQRSGLRTLVLEKGKLANTVVDYHRGKYVMDEPTVIPVRSDLPFRAGSREAVLEMWEHTVAESDIEIRRSETVQKVVTTGEGFTVQTDKTIHHGRNVVLAIGVQGAPRSLQVPGEQYPHVSSHLVDPNLYHDLDIVVVGAGEAAIEEALALSDSNRVVMVNRSKEFYRLKETLEQAIIKKVEAGKVSVFHNATVERIDEDAVDLRLPDGITRIKAHVVFKRVGAEVPRAFLETMGIVFLEREPVSRPTLGANYETSSRAFVSNSVHGPIEHVKHP